MYLLYQVDRRIQPPLSSLALEVADLAGFYYTVNRYMEEVFTENDGRVLQALVSFLEDYMKEYFIMLSQLDIEFRKVSVVSLFLIIKL